MVAGNGTTSQRPPQRPAQRNGAIGGSDNSNKTVTTRSLPSVHTSVSRTAASNGGAVSKNGVKTGNGSGDNAGDVGGGKEGKKIPTNPNSIEKDGDAQKPKISSNPTGNDIIVDESLIQNSFSLRKRNSERGFVVRLSIGPLVCWSVDDE